jgi:hypothetical protein
MCYSQAIQLAANKNQLYYGDNPQVLRDSITTESVVFGFCAVILGNVRDLPFLRQTSFVLLRLRGIRVSRFHLPTNTRVPFETIRSGREDCHYRDSNCQCGNKEESHDVSS